MTRAAGFGRILAIALAAAAVACGGEHQTQGPAGRDASVGASDASHGGDAGGSTEDGSVATCTIPAGATVTGDGAGGQCAPHTITGNGKDVCGPAEYGEVCMGVGQVNPLAPDAALGCRIVPIPTPQGVTFYCCACGGAGDAAPEDDADPGACGEIDAACGSCCAGLTCYGARCCQTYGPCDSGSVCCEPLAACIVGQCVIHPQ